MIYLDSQFQRIPPMVSWFPSRNVMVEGRGRRKLLLVAGKQRGGEGEGEVKGLGGDKPFQVMPLVTYFLQLGLTSQ